MRSRSLACWPSREQLPGGFVDVDGQIFVLARGALRIDISLGTRFQSSLAGGKDLVEVEKRGTPISASRSTWLPPQHDASFETGRDDSCTAQSTRKSPDQSCRSRKSSIMARILIIDPDPLHNAKLCAALQGRGHTVLGLAGNGRDPIKSFCKRVQFDLVVIEFSFVKIVGKCCKRFVVCSVQKAYQHPSCALPEFRCRSDTTMVEIMTRNLIETHRIQPVSMSFIL